MQHVLVTGEDVNEVGLSGSFLGQRTDHVISFIAAQLENRNAIGFERSPNIGQLLRQIARHLTSVGFVTSVLNFLECLSLQVEPAYCRDLASLLVAKGGGGHIEDSGQVFWREVIAQLPKHVDENVSRSGGQPGFSRHSSLPRHGVIRAKNKRHGIN